MSEKPSLLERLSALIMREPEDREQLLTLLRSAHDLLIGSRGQPVPLSAICERAGVSKVLNAAAMTYVAAMVWSVLTLRQFGMLARDRD